MEMQFLNRVELRGLVGHCGCRTTLIDGRQLARFTLATNIQLAEEDKCLTIETSWFSIDAWEGDRITGLDRLTKGTPVHLTGRLRQVRYTDSNGFDHSQLEVIADSLTILEGKLTNETNNNRFDVNARFQDFRDSLSAEVLNMVRKAGGRIDLGGGSVALEFTSVRYYNDVLGDVMAVSLTLSEEEPDRVMFTYVTPEWCEDNSDYIEEGDDETEYKVALDELSANELYNILKLINQ